ncbi:MAG: 1-deoxy-D-xylulose-5-phosphate reductoisomerase [Chlamydiales bacterium]|nr:1-deoxy-D-xylulose-5-phosphate reductoisomerase [Chlamydiales bacterium]
MKKLSILGSTGSIGRSTLKLVTHLSGQFEVSALAAKSNIELLREQALHFNPKIIAVADEEKALELQKQLPQFKVVGGMDGVVEAATVDGADMVVAAMTGAAGIVPTVAAIEAGKDIALANKEVLVSAGAYVMERVRQKGVRLIPVDSEHCALFQCLDGEKRKAVRRLILTASGGPFRTYDQEQLRNVTVAGSLKHPNWDMGPKVTIDCSTLMNKGLEVLEAHWLFDIPLDQIAVVIHPQSLIHSMVEFVDGSILAQMGMPDMLTPIQYALTYPERHEGLLNPFDFTKSHKLEFFPPDYEKFPCLSLAYQAGCAGGTAATYMNAANEVLVERFVAGTIHWSDIGTKLGSLLSQHNPQPATSLESILEVDSLARQEASYV